MLVLSCNCVPSGTGRHRLSLIEWAQQLPVGIVIQAILIITVKHYILAACILTWRFWGVEISLVSILAFSRVVLCNVKFQVTLAMRTELCFNISNTVQSEFLQVFNFKTLCYSQNVHKLDACETLLLVFYGIFVHRSFASKKPAV